jgi:phage replication-related protein YjqB (UPF0714/DUF867 family)
MFSDLLAHPGVEEVCELRSTFGFMAYHGGQLEETTDVIAGAAAALSGASYYGVHQPADVEHLSSLKFSPSESPALQRFIDHVEIVITIHGFGRHGMFTSLLFGGQNRALAEHVAGHVRSALPAYQVITDLEAIPKELRGLHPANPVNLPRCQGLQIELPPRVRGTSPLWWDWEGPGPTPHTQSLIESLARAATTWQ